MNQELKTMKTTMKTMILGFLVLTLALGFTSCGDKEDDPTPSNPNEITIDQLVGKYNTVSVLFNGKSITDACDDNWGSVVNMRKIDLNFKGGTYNFTDLTSYSCSNGTTVTYNILDNIASISDNVLDLDGVYKFKVLSLSNGTLKLELLSTTAITTPIGAVYTLSK
jgi:hypothetical protein